MINAFPEKNVIILRYTRSGMNLQLWTGITSQGDTISFALSANVLSKTLSNVPPSSNKPASYYTGFCFGMSLFKLFPNTSFCFYSPSFNHGGRYHITMQGVLDGWIHMGGSKEASSYQGGLDVSFSEEIHNAYTQFSQ